MKKGKVAQLVNEAKVNQEKMNQLIREFDPLIKNYCKKLYFCEKEDAQQELTLAIIEAVRRMISCESEGGCIMYISNAVKYKYISLCKKNIIKENIEDVYSDVQLEQVNKEFDDYSVVDLEYDYRKILNNLSEKKKNILSYMEKGYSDRQISEIMNISRQYVNRVRKEIVITLRNLY